FEGLRALLVPEEKRAPFSSTERRRHHKAFTSVEFAGRWSLLRPIKPSEPSKGEEAIEAFARVLLRRYGIVFRRMMERESLHVSWFDLSRASRRLEARAVHTHGPNNGTRSFDRACTAGRKSSSHYQTVLRP